MRVLFDGYYWFDGPPAGIVITHEKIAAWRREFPDDVLTVALRRSPSPEEASDLKEQGVRWIRTYLPTQPLKNMVELSLRVRFGPYDMAWGSNYAPLLGKSAVFVHDALFQSNPEWFTTIERIYLSPIMIAAREASVLFVSSRTEAARIVQHNPRLVPTAVTGFGISHALLDARPAPPSALDLRPGSFVLSVGRLNTRKNLATTLSAAVRSGAISPDRPFVVVGPANGKADQLEPPVHAAIDDGSIRYTGFVETEQLAWLYRNTALFVYLSLNEGYGLPPLEALRLGAPVLVSERPIFRELLGEAVRYCDPTDVDAVARAMTLCLSTEPPPMPTGFEFPSWEHMVHVMRTAMIDPQGVRHRRLHSRRSGVKGPS
ncbi:glycosyltransferase family 1 protein [Rhodococcus sp. IEGM 1374]|uniref:glycosyltransferase family 4 protein n=1 Tax=Rhodococcus sp. IEGM 1374 TaxID=3082221 RepID=UPI0029541481|nr:glycosyltransferase family 1 protein [Rhodococcus sp. IEGM 1374]MDV7991220.1 glycosyltransferase family 1 protein [Rhodococcus sp. IEGM 1374]